MARQKKVCIEGDCTEPVWAYMRCQRHATYLINHHPEEVVRLQGMTREEKDAMYAKLISEKKERMEAAKPRWEYTNDEGEAELARLAELERP